MKKEIKLISPKLEKIINELKKLTGCNITIARHPNLAAYLKKRKKEGKGLPKRIILSMPTTPPSKGKGEPNYLIRMPKIEVRDPDIKADSTTYQGDKDTAIMNLIK